MSPAIAPLGRMGCGVCLFLGGDDGGMLADLGVVD